MQSLDQKAERFIRSQEDGRLQVFASDCEIGTWIRTAVCVLLSHHGIVWTRADVQRAARSVLRERGL